MTTVGQMQWKNKRLEVDSLTTGLEGETTERRQKLHSRIP